MLRDDQSTGFADERSFEPGEIRRLENGAIDLAHYARRGRALHGAAVRGAGRSSASAFGRLWRALRRRRAGGTRGDIAYAPAE